MSLTRAWRNTRQFIRQGYVLKLQHSYIRIFLRCFILKSRTNMQNYETSKGGSRDTNSSITSTSPKVPERDDKGLDVANKKERRDAGGSSEKIELEVPENFSEMERQIFIAHKNAIEANYDTYADPLTGFDVFTHQALLNRGKCCGNACRHCPYGHINVPEHLRTKTFNSQFYT